MAAASLAGLEPLASFTYSVGRAGLHKLCAIKSTARSSADRTIVFSHATGFCKEVFLPVMRSLRQQGLDNADFVAFDVRTHGDSAVANHAVLDPKDGNNWWGFADDLVDFVEWIKSTKETGHQIFGVGHSSGGTAMLMAALMRPGLFNKLIVAEPILYPEAVESSHSPLAEGAAKRRPYFSSRENAYMSFKKRAFEAWNDDALRLYVNNGIRDLTMTERSSIGGNMTVALKCTPQHEMEMYLGGPRTYEMFQRLGEVTTPTLVLYGESNPAFPPEHWSLLAQRLVHGTELAVPNTGHLLVMEDPSTIAKIVIDAIKILPQATTQAKL